MALDADGLRKLIEGFSGSVLFPIVATAALPVLVAMKSWRCGELISMWPTRRCG
jgi:hypothetical protein